MARGCFVAVRAVQKRLSSNWNRTNFSWLRNRNPDEVIHYLKKGLPVGSVKWLGEQIELPELQCASLLQIAGRTLARRKKEGHLQAAESERVFRVSTLFEKAIQVLNNREAAKQWFKSPQKALAGNSPLEYCDTEIGAREVEDLLGRIEHGVFG
jgi:putative toxin-antitoxin system antitoxin component (TIGR02293 family)